MRVDPMKLKVEVLEAADGQGALELRMKALASSPLSLEQK